MQFLVKGKKKALLKNMKFLLLTSVLSSLAMLAYSMPAKRSNLNEDFKDFEKLLTRETKLELLSIMLKYSKPIGKAVKYANSYEFDVLLGKAVETKEFRDLALYLMIAGMSQQDAFESINKLIKANFSSALKYESKESAGSLIDMLSEFKNVFPKENMKKLFDEKMKTSQAYKNFYLHLHSKEVKQMLSAFLMTPEAQDLIRSSNQNGLPLVELVDFCLFSVGLKFDPEECHNSA